MGYGIWKPTLRTDRVCVLPAHIRVFSRFYRSFTWQDFFNFFDRHRFTEPYIDDSFAAGNDASREFFENFHHQSFSGNSAWNQDKDHGLPPFLVGASLYGVPFFKKICNGHFSWSCLVALQ